MCEVYWSEPQRSLQRYVRCQFTSFDRPEPTRMFTAVHLNFCPVGPPAPFSWLPPRTLLDWLPGFMVSEKQRKNAERALSYLEKGFVLLLVSSRLFQALMLDQLLRSAYYVMQHLTVSYFHSGEGGKVLNVSFVHSASYSRLRAQRFSYWSPRLDWREDVTLYRSCFYSTEPHFHQK